VPARGDVEAGARVIGFFTGLRTCWRACGQRDAVTDAELFDAFTTYQQGRALSPRTVKRRATSLRGLAGFVAPWSVREATRGTSTYGCPGWEHRRRRTPTAATSRCSSSGR
jgi:hypothetical protein